MENRKQKLLWICLCLFCAGPLAAQENESATVVSKTAEGFSLSQIISFPAVPDALYYEVEIEAGEGETFVPEAKIESPVNKVEVTLRAGSYRYRIKAINKMGIAEGSSGWQDFIIRPAIQPLAERYAPFYGLYYELTDSRINGELFGVIAVHGRDFSEDAEFALVPHQKDYDWSGVTLENKPAILPRSVTVEGSERAVLRFSREKLKSGEYDIFVRNPGGLWTVLGRVRAGYRRSADFTFSFGYAPMIAFFDAYRYEFNGWSMTMEERAWLDRFNPVGFYGRLGWLPVKTRFGSLGLETQIYFLADKIRLEQWGGDERSNFFNTLDSIYLDLLFQKTAGTRWQHSIRAGLGTGETYADDHSPGPHEGGKYDWLFLNAGYSAQFFVWKNLYLEAGLDLQYMVGHRRVMLRPAVGLGWQTGKWAEYAQVAEGARRGEDYSVPVRDMPGHEFTLALGWSPLIPLFGIDPYDTYSQTPFVGPLIRGEKMLEPFNPLGMNLRAAYIPYRWGVNKLGAELNFAILHRTNKGMDKDDSYYYIDLLSHLFVGPVYQRKLAESWQLDVRTGIGLSHPYNFGSGDGRWDENIVFAFFAGASAQYFFWKNAYVEAGLDFVFTLHDRERHGILRPGIGIGWQFNRDTETGLRLRGTALPRFGAPPAAPAADTPAVPAAPLPEETPAGETPDTPPEPLWGM